MTPLAIIVLTLFGFAALLAAVGLIVKLGARGFDGFIAGSIVINMSYLPAALGGLLFIVGAVGGWL